ncbi:MAG: formylglycine-generating enzyme family protein [Pseudomonadota bacterium]
MRWSWFSSVLSGIIVLVSAAVSLGGSEAVYENTIGMRFVLVPAGEFLMGSDELPETLATGFPGYPRERLADLRDETPVHAVRISRPFYLGRHEVTRGQFRYFVEASGYVPESEADGTGGYGYNPAYDPEKSARGDAFDGRDQRYSWQNPGFYQSDDHPVVNITWNDAVAMAEWLSRKEGRRYRLPTEAEWEYACRAGTKTRYYSGNDPASLVRIANTFDSATRPFWPQWKTFSLEENDKAAFTAPVGQYLPNPFGLHDMLGNVWEWVSDWYGENYYAESPNIDPPGPAAGAVRVRRGGSWHTWSLYVRSAFRNWNTPQTRYTLVGMRLLLEAEESR